MITQQQIDQAHLRTLRRYAEKQGITEDQLMDRLQDKGAVSDLCVKLDDIASVDLEKAKKITGVMI